MKKILLISVAILAFSIIASVTLAPSVAHSQKTAKSLLPVIPENVMKTLKASCAACHSNNGGGMASGSWNLDAWSTYSATKQAKKANAIYKAAKNGSMPPSSFSGPKPDANQIKDLGDWATSLQPKK